MTNRERQLQSSLVASFLVERGWAEHKKGARLVQYRAPVALEAGEPFLLSLPLTDVDDGQVVLRRAVATLAEVYSASQAQLEELFSSPGSILSVQLRDRDTESGSVTLIRFEAFVEKIKKTLEDVAAFVITEQPTVRAGNKDVELFIRRCRVLQSEYGSYVARIQLPTAQPLVQPTLFDEEVLTSSAVADRLADVLAFVVGPVFKKDPDILTEDFWLESRALLNVDVLDDVNDLFTKVAAEEMNFTFTGLSGERAISSGRITEIEHSRLATFVEYVRERVNDVVTLDVIGRIIKLHSRNPMQNRNYVAIASTLADKPITIGVTLRSADYAIAVQAHRQNKLVRIRGRAQRLKTQYSITALEVLEPADKRAETI